VIGMVAGFNNPWTLSDAATVASRISFCLAGAIGLVTFIGGVTEMSVCRTWRSVGWVLAMAGFASAVAYVLTFFMCSVLIVFFYYPMSGMGVLWGALIGVTIWAGFAFGVLRAEYRHWRSRQANWPKWEEMRRGHRRRGMAAINLTVREVLPPEQDPRLPTGAA
jgi:hypothetical protein